MAKAITGTKRQKRVDLDNLTQRDIDFVTLEPKDVMKKYKLQKQSVYDRRFAINKRIKQAGKTIEELVNSPVQSEAEPVSEPIVSSEPKAKRGRPKKVQTNVGRPKKEQPKMAETEKVAPPAEEKLSENRDMMVISKQVPIIMKPIEINFDNFSIKLNGVPKKISVNPDTNAIEIDL